MKYKVTYYENYYSTVEVEAESPEDAERQFWWKWENDELFVDEVLSTREVVHSELDVL